MEILEHLGEALVHVQVFSLGGLVSSLTLRGGVKGVKCRHKEHSIAQGGREVGWMSSASSSSNTASRGVRY